MNNTRAFFLWLCGGGRRWAGSFLAGIELAFLNVINLPNFSVECVWKVDFYTSEWTCNCVLSSA